MLDFCQQHGFPQGSAWLRGFRLSAHDFILHGRFSLFEEKKEKENRKKRQLELGGSAAWVCVPRCSRRNE